VTALLKNGAPLKELWLTECTSVKAFYDYYGQEDWGLEGYRGVVYYHESGSVHVLGGFNNDAEFEEACRYVAHYLAPPAEKKYAESKEVIPNPFPRLFSDQVWSQLLENGRQSAEQEKDHIPVVRIITANLNPQAVWVLSEIMPHDPKTAFGLCDLGHGSPELGYVYLPEITSVPQVVLLSDPGFAPTEPLSTLAEEARKRGYA
jgi:hypothetical protein